MNKRKVLSVLTLQRPALNAAFAVCAAAFAFGAVFGTVSAGDSYSGGAVEEAVYGYFAAFRDGDVMSDIASIYWWLAKYHALCFLLGFSVLGAVGIPALTFIRGFALSYTMALLVRLYSVNGAIAGAALFGAAALISVPLYFIIAVGALEASFGLARAGLFLAAPSGPGIYTRPYFVRSVIVFLLLALIAIGERAIILSDLFELPIFR